MKVQSERDLSGRGRRRMMVARQLVFGVLALCAACTDSKMPGQITAPSPTPGTPSALALNAIPGIGTESESATIMVRVTDAANTGLPDVAVQLSTTAGRFEAETLMTNADGRASTTLISATTAQVTATAGALTKTIAVDAVGGFWIQLNVRPSGTPSEVIPMTLTVVRFVPDLEFASGTMNFGDGGVEPLTLVGNPPSASFSHRYDRPGVYALTASVTDVLGSTQQARTTLTIFGPPSPPAPSGASGMVRGTPRPW